MEKSTKVYLVEVEAKNAHKKVKSGKTSERVKEK